MMVQVDEPAIQGHCVAPSFSSSYLLDEEMRAQWLKGPEFMVPEAVAPLSLWC